MRTDMSEFTEEERRAHIQKRNREKSQRWRATNAEKHRQQVKDWRKRNPDRVRVYEANNRNKFRDKRRKTWREWAARDRAANPQKGRHAHLRLAYGLSPEQFDTMLNMQGGCCAICRTDKPGGLRKQWHVDHCHTTNTVRSLLCHGCNTGLGAFGDNIEMLEKAIQYLRKHAGGL